MAKTAKIALIVSVILCGMVFASLTSNVEKLLVYADEQGFTWQQMQNATMRQFITHCTAAGVDPNDLRGSKHSVRRMFIAEKQKRIKDNKAIVLWTHIRKAGSDVETVRLIRYIFENPEVVNVDPNAFN